MVLHDPDAITVVCMNWPPWTEAAAANDFTPLPRQLATQLTSDTLPALAVKLKPSPGSPSTYTFVYRLGVLLWLSSRMPWPPSAPMKLSEMRMECTVLTEPSIQMPWFRVAEGGEPGPLAVAVATGNDAGDIEPAPAVQQGHKLRKLPLPDDLETVGCVGFGVKVVGTGIAGSTEVVSR